MLNLAEICQGITASRATGDELSVPHWLTTLAATYCKAGYTVQGLTTVAETFARTANSKDVPCEAELYHLKGSRAFQQENQKSKRPS